VELKDLATRTTAFLAGLAGPAGLQVFERWAYEHAVRFTPAVNFAAYMILFVGPFVTFALGIDPRRWQPDYGGAFGPGFQAEYRQLAIRGVLYFVGSIVGSYAFFGAGGG
jgi:hypothetical protein